MTLSRRAAKRDAQPGLFVQTRVEKCPLCSYQHHCGHLAEYGEPVETAQCVNATITCCKCGATGVESTRKDLQV